MVTMAAVDGAPSACQASAVEERRGACEGVAVGGVGGHLAWVCAWRDGDGVSLDSRHFAIALRLASRRPAHTGHSVDTTAFVKTTAADLCRRYMS